MDIRAGEAFPSAKKRGLCPKPQRHFKGPYKGVEKVTEVLYHVAPVGEGTEIVLDFNRLKPNLSSFLPSDPALTQAHGEPTPPRQLVAVPGQSTASGCEADDPWTRRSLPSDGAAPVQNPVVGRSEQGAVRPRQHQNPVTTRGGTTRRGCVRDPNSFGGEMDINTPLEKKGLHPLQPEEGNLECVLAQEGQPVQERRAPVWSRDYDLWAASAWTRTQRHRWEFIVFLPWGNFLPVYRKR